MNNFVELRQIVGILLPRWPLLLLGVLLGSLVGYGASRLQTPVYEAATTINIGRAVAALNVARQDLQVNEQLLLTYADLARRQPVLRGVITTLNLETTWQQLKNRVRARPIENTQLLEIVVKAGSAQEAQQVADALAHQLIAASSNATANQSTDPNAGEFARERLERLQKKIVMAQQRVETLETLMGDVNNSIEKLEALQTEMKTLEALLADWDSTYSRLLAAVSSEQAPNRLSVVEAAELNSSPTQPRVPLNILLGSVVGFSLAALALFLAEHWNTTLRTAEDITQSLGVVSLGGITRGRGWNKQEKLVFNRNDTAAVAEEYRLLRSKLQFITANWPRKILLSASLTPNEQNSLIVANLGAVLALAGYKTVVVDANLRQPQQHEVFQLPNRRGLTELLLAPVPDFDGYLQNTSVKNLQLLTAGGLPTYPSELLSSEKMHALLADLTAQADIVICDCADAATFADAAALASHVDGVLLAVEANRVPRELAQQVLHNLRQAGGNLVGAILLPVPGSRSLTARSLQTGAVKPLGKVGGAAEEVRYTPVESLPTNAAD